MSPGTKQDRNSPEPQCQCHLPQQGLCHSSPLLPLSHSLHTLWEEHSTLPQQQHKAEGKGEGKALAHCSPWPAGQCRWLGWEHEQHSEFPVKAVAVEGAGTGAGNMQQEAGCAARHS